MVVVVGAVVVVVVVGTCGALIVTYVLYVDVAFGDAADSVLLPHPVC